MPVEDSVGLRVTFLVGMLAAIPAIMAPWSFAVAQSTPPPSATPVVLDAVQHEQATFERRFEALKRKVSLFEVRMPTEQAPNPGPGASEETPNPALLLLPGSGLVPIAAGRADIYTPPLLSPDDVQSVVQEHGADIRACYGYQLRKHPGWADNLILDLAIRRTGRVTEVSIAPRRVRSAPIGRCLMRIVPRWRFPRFTGETGDGITQEVITVSVPFHFGRR